ncbi:MAG: hypothetical protein ABR588_10350 [Sphingomicrobium sp.]
MPLHSSRIVLTSARRLPGQRASTAAGTPQPYTVVVTRGLDGHSVTEHPVATMREGEALIRSLSPTRVPPRDREYRPTAT